MAIAFDCPSCHKSFSVADEFAGRVGTCKGCGHSFTVPAARALVADEEDEYGIATEGYGLVDAPAKQPDREAEHEEQNVFARTYDEEFDRPPPRKTAKRKSPRRRRDDDEGFFEKHGKQLIWLGVGAAIVLAGVAFFVPGGKNTVGLILLATGLLLVLAGQFIGIYVAFTEDSMYGFLCWFIPLYQAYYLVTRWDDMWPWFSMQLAGLGLLILGAPLLDQEVPQPGADAHISRPAESILVLRPWMYGNRLISSGV